MNKNLHDDAYSSTKNERCYQATTWYSYFILVLLYNLLQFSEYEKFSAVYLKVVKNLFRFDSEGKSKGLQVAIINS